MRHFENWRGKGKKKWTLMSFPCLIPNFLFWQWTIPRGLRFYIVHVKLALVLNSMQQQRALLHRTRNIVVLLCLWCKKKMMGTLKIERGRTCSIAVTQCMKHLGFNGVRMNTEHPKLLYSYNLLLHYLYVNEAPLRCQCPKPAPIVQLITICRIGAETKCLLRSSLINR